MEEGRKEGGEVKGKILQLFDHIHIMESFVDLGVITVHFFILLLSVFLR